MRKNHVVSVVLFISMYFVCVINFPFWLGFFTIIEKADFVKPGFSFAIFVFLSALFNIVFMMFSFRFVLKPVFVILFIVSSVVSYMAYKYHVVFDDTMVQNIFETHRGEALSYLNVSLILWVFLMGGIPSIILYLVKIEYPASWRYSFSQRFMLVRISLATIFIILPFYHGNYVSIRRDNPTLKYEIIPFSYLSNGAEYIYDRYFPNFTPFMTVGDDAIRQDNSQKPTLFFLVIGETARSANYALNGYERDTNPFTSKIDNMVSFTNVSSCGTSTVISIPCMFSVMTRQNYDSHQARNSEGLLDILQKTGISVLWKENDGGCKGVCDRVPTIEIKPENHPELCNATSCHDAVLLKNLDNEIAAMQGDRLVAFHLVGSHGPDYYQRYPEKDRFFTPDCARGDVENCAPGHLVNTYDNTIRYTDFILSELIGKLKSYEDTYNVGLIYLADHGESLGEFDIYLHGFPYDTAPDYQKKIPFQVWFSDGFIEEKKLNMDCLKAQKTLAYSHDNFFSSMLGLWNVKTSVYDESLDMFYQCRER